MVVASVVLVVCSVVVLLGAATELRDVLRARRETGVGAAPGASRSRSFDVLTWFGLAAVVVLAPSLWRTSTLPLGDVLLVVLLLGFAAERAAYLLGRRGGAGRRALGTPAVAAATVLGGLAVAVTT